MEKEALEWEFEGEVARKDSSSMGDQRQAFRAFEGEAFTGAGHGALPEGVIRLGKDFAVQEFGARIPAARPEVGGASSISTLAIGVPRSVIRRAMAELSSGAIDDRTALATGFMDRSSPEFPAKYVEERLREFWRGSGRRDDLPFDPLATAVATAATPRFVPAWEEEAVPPTAAIEPVQAMNPQHKSPWGVYTFRDLWTHHSIPSTLLVATIAFGCYGIGTIVDTGAYPWVLGIVITLLILATAGYLRSHFGKDQSAFHVPLFSLIFAWFMAGAVLVVADRWRVSLLKLLDNVL